MDDKKGKWIKKPVSAKFTEARLARGIKMPELAEKVGVSRQSISKYERGESTPTFDVFHKIADALEFPEAFFFQQEPFENQALGFLYFRSLKSTENMKKAQYSVRLEWLRREEAYLEKYMSLPVTNLPQPEEKSFEDITLDDIENAAERLRRHWKLGDNPISNLTRLVEFNGILTCRFNYGDTHIDACSKIEQGRAYILLSADKSNCVRSRFDIAHELGHFMLHAYLSEEEYDDEELFKTIERQAHDFAGAFLMPRRTFGYEVHSSSLDHFMELKKRWKTSITSMIMRADRIGLFSEKQVRNMWLELGRRKWKKREPLDEELIIEEPSLFREALAWLEDVEKIPIEENIRALNISEKDFGSLCNIAVKSKEVDDTMSVLRML